MVYDRGYTDIPNKIKTYAEFERMVIDKSESTVDNIKNNGINREILYYSASNPITKANVQIFFTETLLTKDLQACKKEIRPETFHAIIISKAPQRHTVKKE